MRWARSETEFKGDGSVAGVLAEPLDGDGAGAGADVPEELAGERGEAGEGAGAEFALGELAVGLEGVVREAGDEGEGAGGLRVAGERDEVEVGRAGIGVEGNTFGVAAQVGEDLEGGVGVAALVQKGGYLLGSCAVFGQEEEALVGGEMADEVLEGAGYEGEDRGLVGGPAEAGAGEGDGGEGGQDAELGGGQGAGESGADAEEHGVAGGEDGGLLFPCKDFCEGGGHGRGPRDACGVGGGVGGDQGEVAGGAAEGGGLREEFFCFGGEGGPALFVDAQDGEPRGHADSFWGPG